MNVRTLPRTADSTKFPAWESYPMYRVLHSFFHSDTSWLQFCLISRMFRSTCCIYNTRTACLPVKIFFPFNRIITSPLPKVLWCQKKKFIVWLCKETNKLAVWQTLWQGHSCFIPGTHFFSIKHICCWFLDQKSLLLSAISKKIILQCSTFVILFCTLDYNSTQLETSKQWQATM